jgi:hypothetical protein
VETVETAVGVDQPVPVVPAALVVLRGCWRWSAAAEPVASEARAAVMVAMAEPAASSWAMAEMAAMGVPVLSVELELTVPTVRTPSPVAAAVAAGWAVTATLARPVVMVGPAAMLGFSTCLAPGGPVVTAASGAEAAGPVTVAMEAMEGRSAQREADRASPVPAGLVGTQVQAVAVESSEVTVSPAQPAPAAVPGRVV